MEKLVIIVVLLLSACNVSTSKHYNIAITGGVTHEDNLKAAQVIGANVWHGQLKHLIKKQISELKDVNLDQVLGIRFQNMTFSNGEKGAFIQCTFKSTGSEEVSNKVIVLCRTEVEREMTKYFTAAASNK